MEYQSSFVASTSDFWWDPVQKASFAGCIANFMASSYPLHDGQHVFVSNTTMKNADSSQCCSQCPKIGRCQALLSFTLFDVEHTGANIGQWIEDVHSKVKCVPDFIGSHTVDGAANAGLAVEDLNWNTAGD